MTKPARLALLTLLAAACGEPEQLVRLDQEGDPCRAAYGICLNEEMVRDCVDGAWVDRSCAESCAEHGPAMMSAGCSEASSEIPVEGCQCIPEPGYCFPGETSCESDTQLNYCNDAQEWTTHDCVEVCAASLATPVSTGCSVDDDEVAACWCQVEP